jgi:hypothetical protein
MFCGVHNDTIECRLCEKCPPVHDRYKLSCGHAFCKDCLSENMIDNQWFDGFSTDTPLKCPECELLFLDKEWSFITDYLCQKRILYRKIVHKTYLCPLEFVELKGSIDIGKEYTYNELDKIRSNVYGRYSNKTIVQSEITDIVYFYKTFLYPRTVYTFEYGDYLIRDHFKHIHKELVEYVFHPSRIKIIEDLDDM